MKMKVGQTPKNTSMYLKGFRAFVQWNDGSKSYYKNKRIAISEMRREQARKSNKRNGVYQIKMVSRGVKMKKTAGFLGGY